MIVVFSANEFDNLLGEKFKKLSKITKINFFKTN